MERCECVELQCAFNRCLDTGRLEWGFAMAPGEKHGAAVTKLQTPNFKLQRNPKLQTPKSKFLACVLLFGFAALCTRGEVGTNRVLTSAEEVRRLTAGQAEQHFEGTLRGTVNVYDELLFS